jgi:hypothetical protein
VTRFKPVAAALASLSMAGCIPPATPPSSPPLDTTADQCGAGKLRAYLNQLPTSDAMDRIRAEVGERPIRTIRPGEAVTMDFAPARLNIEIGEDGRIGRFRCG